MVARMAELPVNERQDADVRLASITVRGTR